MADQKQLHNVSSEGAIVDPIEYGRLLHAVETIANQMDGLPAGLQHANNDIRYLKDHQSKTEEKLDALIEHVKHLNGAEQKLEELGFRREDAKEHRKDQLFVRELRRRKEKRSSMLYKAKATLIASISFAVLVWVASTLWAARHTIS